MTHIHLSFNIFIKLQVYKIQYICTKQFSHMHSLGIQGKTVTFQCENINIKGGSSHRDYESIHQY